MADALASGASDRKVVWVQVPSPAPIKSTVSRGNRGVLFFLFIEQNADPHPLNVPSPAPKPAFAGFFFRLFFPIHSFQKHKKS